MGSIEKLKKKRPSLKSVVTKLITKFEMLIKYENK